MALGTPELLIMFVVTVAVIVAVLVMLGKIAFRRKP